jgi:FAD/FMN-containing dehydrogenase/SAM-dependent methyltransferase
MWAKIESRLPELGRLSSIPADMIENAYLSEPTTAVGQTWQKVKVRAYYLGLFLPAVAADLGVSLAGSFRNYLGVLTRADKSQKEKSERLQKYGTLVSKNAIALLVWPFGLYDPKLVELHFATDKPTKGIRSGGHAYEAPDVLVKYPEDAESVQEIVRQAAAQGYKVMPVGAGFSQGKQFIPEGAHGEKTVAIDLSNMDTVQIDADNKTATIGAGVRWHEVQTHADKHGLALKVMQASNVFSAGGSVGTNIHGWDHQTGMLSNAILSMTVVNAQGEKQTLTPRDELFHYVTGGLGLFGIVTSLTIKLTENELLKEVGTEVPLSDYVTYFREQVLPNENIRMHLFRLSLDPKDLLGSGVAVDYVRVGEVRKKRTVDLTQESTYGSRTDQIMVNVARRIPLSREHYWTSERNRLLANGSAPQTTNVVMQPIINALFHDGISEAEWLQEYFLPGESLQKFLHALGRILMDNEVPLLNASVRFVKQNEQAPMSYAHDGDRFAVVLCFTQSLQAAQRVKASKWLREAQKLAIEHGGTYYLPYQHVSDPEDFHAAYPLAAQAMRKKRELDPNEVFSSGLYQKYLAELTREPSLAPNYFHQLVKDEATKRRFAGFLKVVLKRVESDHLFALLEDILTYKDSHAEIYSELCARLPEIAPNALNDFRLILNSLSSIKQDLAEQACSLLDGVTKINGLVEIGYPGRFVRGFTDNFDVTGKIVAVYEAPSLADFIQTGCPRPYHQFAKLDYSEPDLRTLKSKSADVMTCYVGLHHFPENRLKFFLKEIARVLRPGGQFLLVDHDVRNEEELAMAHGAHMIFNAVTGASLEDEMSELRFFAPMTHWQELLAEVGLEMVVSGPQIEMIREGDPSRNRMVSFKKAPELSLELSRESESEHADWRRRSSPSVASAESAVFSRSATRKRKDEDGYDSSTELKL